MEEEMYNYIVNRQYDFNKVITQNEIDDPNKKDKTKNEQNLMNFGAMQFVSELVEKFPLKRFEMPLGDKIK